MRAINDPAIVVGSSAVPAARTAIVTPSLRASRNNCGRTLMASVATERVRS